MLLVSVQMVNYMQADQKMVHYVYGKQRLVRLTVCGNVPNQVNRIQSIQPVKFQQFKNETNKQFKSIDLFKEKKTRR